MDAARTIRQHELGLTTTDYPVRSDVSMLSISTAASQSSGKDVLQSTAGGDPAGGKTDILKQSGNEKYNFARAVWPSHGWFTWGNDKKVDPTTQRVMPSGRTMFTRGLAQFYVVLTKIEATQSLEEGKDWCLRLLGAKGLAKNRCQDNGCPRKHKLTQGQKAKVTVELMQEHADILLLYLHSHWGGPICDPNGDMSFEDLKKKCVAMKTAILAKDEENETDDEDDDNGSDSDDAPSTPATRPRPTTRSRNTNGQTSRPLPRPSASAAGQDPATVPSGGSNEEETKTVTWDFEEIEEEDPCGKKPSTGGLAAKNRAFFDGFISPQLLPEDRENFSLSPAVDSKAVFGGVKVLRQADLTIELKMNDINRVFRLVLHLMDLGEHIGDERQQCDVITHAAAYRVPIEQVQLERKQAVDQFCHHYASKGTTSSEKKPNLWELVSLAQAEEGIPDHVIAMERKVVSAARERGQPNYPIWSSMMLGTYAQGKAEGKWFFESDGKIRLKLLVPWTYFKRQLHCGDTDDDDYPVVFKAYANKHAYAARCRHISVDDTKTTCSENANSVDATTWGGLHVRDLLSMRQTMLEHGIQFEVRVALTMDEVLERRRLVLPNYVYQDGFTMQFGAEIQERFEEVLTSVDNVSSQLHSNEEKACGNPALADGEMIREDPMHRLYGIGQAPSGLLLNLASMFEGDHKNTESTVVMETATGSELSIEEISTADDIEKRTADDIEKRKQSSVKKDGTQTLSKEDFWRGEYEQAALRRQHARHENVDWEQQDTSIPQGISKAAALKMLVRTASAAVNHRQEAYNEEQSSVDPGPGWQDEHGEIMQEVVRWAEAAFSDRPPSTRITLVEQIFRQLESGGHLGPHLLASNVEDFFSDLPEDHMKDLFDLMTEGVDVGIARDRMTQHASPSKTALNNRDKVLKQLRKFMANGYVRAFPPSVWKHLKNWNLLMSPLHFVPSTEHKKNDRLVWNGSMPDDMQEEDGQDINSLSPDMGYGEVQADYIDDMIREITEALLIDGVLDEEEILQFQADIKSAFKTVVIRLNSVGCLCMEFEGWVYVYSRVAFGWKWATHAWSIVAKAIKAKVRTFERNGWSARDSGRDWRRMGQRMWKLFCLRGEGEMTRADKLASKWKMNLAFVYIDDLWSALRGMDQKKAAALADTVRIVGFLLLGPSAWSLSKAEEESFFARVQKHTGVVIHTTFGPEPRASFTKDRVERCMEFVNEILDDPEATAWSLHFFQKAWGNFVWLQKVYRSFKPFAAGLRRPLQGQATVAAREAQDIMVSPRLPKEGVAQGTRKFRRDMATTKTMLQYLIDIKDKYGEEAIETTVPFISMSGIDDWSRLPKESHTSIGGDASGTGWSVLEHNFREIMIMPLPQILSDVLKKKAEFETLDVRETFMVAIAEHLVLVFALLQWGSRWQEQGVQVIRYWTDNQNSHDWVKSMFANNALAQDLCRLIAALCLRYNLHVIPEWLSTHVNKLADLASRVYLTAISRCEKTYEEYVQTNAGLERPYDTVQEVEKTQRLINMLATTSDPFTLEEHIQQEIEAFIKECLAVTPAVEETRHGGLTTQPSMKTELHEYREAWTIDQAKAFLQGPAPGYSVALIGAAAHVATMGVTRAGGKILFSSETDPLKRRLAEDLTGGTALGDLWELDWDRLPKALIWLLTLPCINHARSGNHLGRHGDYGVLFVQAAYVIMHCLPLMFVSEISDFAEFVNNGEDVQMVLDITKPKYVVYKIRLSMAHHGDPSHRKRLALVGILRSFAGATTWKPPQGQYGPQHSHCARDTADEDDEVLDEDKRHSQLHTVYADVAKPPFGVMQKLGRLRPGFAMGPGCDPNLFIGLDGLRNGPTTHGGGGTFPPQSWRQGEQLPWRKVTSITEYYRTASLSMTVKDWHESFLQDMDPAERKKTLRGWVNDGFFVHTVDNIFQSLFALLKEHGVEPDMPRSRQEADEYITEARWLPSEGDVAGGLGDRGRPSEARVQHFMAGVDLDWSLPLYPSKPGQRHHLTGPITDHEWAQMHHGEQFTERMQLRESTWAAYNLQCLKVLEFFQRYPVSETFSEAHAETGLLMQAVWKDQDIETMLIDLTMHEAFVRGNSWGTCRQMLYAFRHINVRKLRRDPLKLKPRLWQLMDGLKKSKGPKKAKHPVCRAMLLVLKELLNHETSLEDMKLWAGILLAFHYMLRSMDWCAKRAGGKFEMDNVLRIGDFFFKRKGRRLHSNFAGSDELSIVFRRGKTTEGGEVRTHVRDDKDPTLCIVSTMGRLFDRMDRSNSELPVMAWPEGSKRAGEGVRYCDVMQLLKTAAEQCGRSSSDYGTHSLRRGGASAYVMAGASVEEVAIFGRWRDSQSVRLYVEPAARGLLLGLEDKVNRGERDDQLLLRRPPRERHEQVMRALLRTGARGM